MCCTTSFRWATDNFFGQMGDNQLGVELMGHSAERPHAIFGRAAQLQRWQREFAFEERLQHIHHCQPGVQCRLPGRRGPRRRLLVLGNGPTYNLTSGGVPITGVGNKPFNREGAFALIYVKKLDFSLFYQHGWDSAYFGTSTPANQPLPPGAQAPSWNGGFVEDALRVQSADDLHPA